jgi:hypothetical protein
MQAWFRRRIGKKRRFQAKTPDSGEIHLLLPRLLRAGGRLNSLYLTPGAPQTRGLGQVRARSCPMPLDPMHLTFETLEAEERRRGGPARIAALDAGIDTTLIDYMLTLTPDQRLARHDAKLRLLQGYLAAR